MEDLQIEPPLKTSQKKIPQTPVPPFLALFTCLDLLQAEFLFNYSVGTDDVAETAADLQ